MAKPLLFNIFFLLIFQTYAQSFSQYHGTVLSIENKQPVAKAKITVGQQSVFSNEKGEFILNSIVIPFQITISAEGFSRKKVTVIELKENEKNIVFLELKHKELSTVVVTAGRRDQKIEEVPISIEIIKPELIANKGLTNLAQAVNQSPGVYTMDGQVSIRGGGGFAYGAGSRVLLLWNGVPMLSPDIGDAKWNAVPMEQASQIEILKGASSVLYGSGALNGIIALNEKEPGPDATLQAKVQTGIYDNPKRSSLKWWDKNPTFHMADVYYGKSIKSYGYTIGTNIFYNEGFRQGEYEKRARINGSFYYRPIKENSNLKAGISYNLQLQDAGVFVLWKNDTSCYQSMDNTISLQKAIRFNFDPYLKFIDKNKNKHYIRTRYYVVTTGNESKVNDASLAQMYYLDYQFQKKILSNTNVTLGATNTLNHVNSWVFGDHIGENAALYSQFETKSGKWDFTTGLRLEFCQLDTLPFDSKLTLGDFNSPIYPILRAGVHYEPKKGTHLRASLGQGIRFPSIAERFVSTSVGGVIIFKNPELRPETGYAGELGIKQIIRIGEWKAMADVAGFANYYSNMTEFAFGLYKPDSISTLQTTNPDTINYFYNWVGFQAQNAEEAFISGVEFSLNSAGKIKEVELTTLIGYTYMNPISLNKDPNYKYSFSDTSTNMLKYRFKHMAKADIQATFKGISIGLSSRYNSYMRNIDKVFESGVLGQELLVGMAHYRSIYNKGTAVFDARIGYQMNEEIKINFIANNFLNKEYVSRPGDVQAPRNFILQMQWAL